MGLKLRAVPITEDNFRPWPAPGKDRRRMRVWIGRRAAQSREWDSQILPHGAQENGAAIQKDNASRQGHAVSGISGSSSLVHGGLSSQHCGSFIATRGRCSIQRWWPLLFTSLSCKLNEGTWHAGPLFGDRDSMVFYNLELSDTNVVDHTTHVFEDDVLIED
ncbi:uncharacterized protein LOC9657510 [Selaginella moellendorffii]|uniref:uncharacterized protein LOC9657510 n=1 Tax=Selaginella moellendorffii TaxID=88036 RepID=UPI000D1C7EE2|nr:uncharacterized protein LOC9657510 [Selaginella moellendorffii]|eukprot:XP_024517675.1 uncharacterized protein LOC9657510 [Selaginella moellendorffii]